jgi:uncharacterized protein YcfL
MTMKKLLSVGLILVFMLVGCSNGTQKPAATKDYKQRADEIVKLMNVHDWATISTYVSANKGVRFSPYANVNTQQNVVISKAVMKNVWAKNPTSVWGEYDGSGLPIQLTFQAYVHKFVYDLDFAHAQVIGNNTIIGKGNSKNNLTDVYPNAKFVEYHFKQVDAENGGMDWRSLRLVFEKHDGQWMLVGIIHDQWTI